LSFLSSQFNIIRVSETKRLSLVFAKEEHAALVRAASPGAHICVSNRSEFLAATMKLWPVSAVAFVDLDLLPQLEGATANVVIVGILDDPRAGVVRSVVAFPWLSHVVTATLLASEHARAHIAMLLEQLDSGPAQNVIDPDAIGRVALLASSVRREARFERMREYFSAQGLPTRTIASCADIAEELVTNALYDAPMEAGYFRAAIQRTQGVELPPDRACEISYGREQGSVFVRVRDPFGALTRTRLLGVLRRCTSAGVALDESRGGAGLGLWRVFSTASSVAITVIPGILTDILVRIEAKRGRTGGRPLLAVNLFFSDEHSIDGAYGRFAADHDHDLLDESFTALRVA
jgi:hypothetical protein